ncbi:hypothetical protein C8R47DRAFT_1230121 [Mycena vitilis]|nr:hypothetical protein C8R47DRAFT_1230121 [Mycena vitilis]
MPDLMGDSDGNFMPAGYTSDSEDETSSSESQQYRSPRMKSNIPVFGAGNTRTVLDMPLRGSRDAPKTFRGHHSEVEYFIAHYDRLLVKFHVNDPEDQCKLILDYCSPDVQGFIRASKYFHQQRWPKLRHEILQSYDVDRATSRYKPSDVATYTLRTKSRPFQNLSQWKKYYRKYKTMAGTLLHQGHITQVNYDVYFWLGIELDLRRTLEQRINQLNPMRNIHRQYSVNEINIAAEWYFRRNRAEAMVINAADYGVDLDSDTTDMESDEESDDSDDSDYETYRRKHRAKAHARKEKEKKKKKKASAAPAVSSKTRTLQTTGTAEEVTSLIRQLNKMSITDPEYAPVYYQVLTLDRTGIAAKCVQPPRLAQPWTDSNKGYAKTAPPKNPVTSTTGNSAGAAGPSTYPNNIPLGAQGPTGCYGCGTDGHRIGECPEVQDLLSKNIIAVDQETRRLRMKDGTFIRRMQGESLSQAARRISAPRVMFHTTDRRPLKDTQDLQAVMNSLAYAENYSAIADSTEMESATCDTDSTEMESATCDTDSDQELDAHWYVMRSDISDTEDFADQGGVYLTVPEPQPSIDPADNEVNAAERTVPSSKAARKEVFDGVMLPRRERQKNEAGPVKAAAAPKETVRRRDDAPRQAKDLLPEITPVDARQPREDVEMPDLELTSRTDSSRQTGMDSLRQTGAVKLTADHGPKCQEESNSKNAVGRHSEIQSTVHIPNIIERILDLTIPMTVREAFVASKDIRNGIMDTIRLKNVKAVLLGRSQDNPLVAQWNWPRTEGVLIKIDVESRGHIISAIIDTGSQLDVVRADVAALKIQRPVDMTYVTNMNDANGGKGQLRGYIHGAELNCGGVLTGTDLWVSHQAPFELLLGRPWQRGNMVTIDEREEGTYLVFKDQDTRQPRYELLAIPYDSIRQIALESGNPVIHMLTCDKEIPKGELPTRWNFNPFPWTRPEDLTKSLSITTLNPKKAAGFTPKRGHVSAESSPNMPLAVEHSQCSPGSLANGQQDEVEESGNQRTRSPIIPITGRIRISPGVGHRTQSPIIPVTGLVRMNPDVEFFQDAPRRTTTTPADETLLSKHATQQMKNEARGKEVRHLRQASEDVALTSFPPTSQIPPMNSRSPYLSRSLRGPDSILPRPLDTAMQGQELPRWKLRVPNRNLQQDVKWAVCLGIVLFGTYLVTVSGAFLAEWKHGPNLENQMRSRCVGLKDYNPTDQSFSFTPQTLFKISATTNSCSTTTTMPLFYRNFVPGAGQHRTVSSPPPRLNPNTTSRDAERENDGRRAATGPLSAVQTAVLARHRVHYFGRVDARPFGGTIHQRLRAAADSSWAGLLQDGEVPSGRQVHHAVFLNARLLIHNPATGQPGTRNGHAIVHFFAAPLDEHATWDIEALYGTTRSFNRQLSHYGPNVHRELEMQRRPGEFLMNANRSLTSIPTSIPEAPPSRTVLTAAIAPRLAPIPEIRTNRFLRDPIPARAPPPRLGELQGQNTGLVDADTGHEVVALPTRAHPTLPAAPRPGTPGPQYRLLEQPPRLRAKRPSSTDGENVQPKKARTQLQLNRAPHHQDILKRMVNERLAQAEALINRIVAQAGNQSPDIALGVGADALDAQEGKDASTASSSEGSAEARSSPGDVEMSIVNKESARRTSSPKAATRRCKTEAGRNNGPNPDFPTLPETGPPPSLLPMSSQPSGSQQQQGGSIQGGSGSPGKNTARNQKKRDRLKKKKQQKREEKEREEREREEKNREEKESGKDKGKRRATSADIREHEREAKRARLELEQRVVDDRSRELRRLWAMVQNDTASGEDRARFQMLTSELAALDQGDDDDDDDNDDLEFPEPEGEEEEPEIEVLGMEGEEEESGSEKSATGGEKDDEGSSGEESGHEGEQGCTACRETGDKCVRSGRPGVRTCDLCRQKKKRCDLVPAGPRVNQRRLKREQATSGSQAGSSQAGPSRQRRARNLVVAPKTPLPVEVLPRTRLDEMRVLHANHEALRRRMRVVQNEGRAQERLNQANTRTIKFLTVAVQKLIQMVPGNRGILPPEYFDRILEVYEGIDGEAPGGFFEVAMDVAEALEGLKKAKDESGEETSPEPEPVPVDGDEDELESDDQPLASKKSPKGKGKEKAPEPEEEDESEDD